MIFHSKLPTKNAIKEETTAYENTTICTWAVPPGSVGVIHTRLQHLEILLPVQFANTMMLKI